MTRKSLTPQNQEDYAPQVQCKNRVLQTANWDIWVLTEPCDNTIQWEQTGPDIQVPQAALCLHFYIRSQVNKTRIIKIVMASFIESLPLGRGNSSMHWDLVNLK